MAENKKNNAAEKEIEAAPTVNENVYVDEYSVSAFDENESNGTVLEGEKLFETKYKIQKTQVIGANGNVYDNYAIAYLVSVAGTQQRQIIRIRPKGGSKTLIQNMSLIMSIPGDHKLEILKRSMRDSKTGAVTHLYSMQVSCKTDEGVSFVCPLEPVATADKAIWENFKKQLVARGDLD